MVILLLLVQLSFSALWLMLVATGVDPIEVPLIASFALWPILLLTYQANIRPIRIVPLLTLIVTVYTAWLTGWDPYGETFPLVAGLGSFLIWLVCTQGRTIRDMSVFWLGLLTYAPLFMMFLMAAFDFMSVWPVGIVMTAQLAALTYAIRNPWAFSANLDSVVILRINGTAMLIVPFIYFTNYLSNQASNSYILGIGGAISAIALTRQQLIYRKRLHQAIQDYEQYAERDSLTERLTLLGFLNALEADERRDWQVVVLDINAFAAMNDRHGHEFGDQLLKAVSARLDAAFPDSHIARFNGDYFVIGIPYLDDDAQTIEASIQAIGFLHLDVFERFSVAVGISDQHPVTTREDIYTLITEADVRMNARKASQRSQRHEATPHPS